LIGVGLRRDLSGSALPKTPANPLHAGNLFSWLQWFAHCYGLSVCSPPLHGSDRIAPAIGDFYIWASGRSVALPTSRDNYNSDWTPCMGRFLSRGCPKGSYPFSCPSVSLFDR